MFGKYVVNFIVTWDRLLLTGGRIEVNVVASAMSQQYAALLKQLANQFVTLQIDISLVWCSFGTSSRTIA